MCLDCQLFFKKAANHLGHPLVVADPTGVRIFYPSGAIAAGPTAEAAIARAAAIAGRTEAMQDTE
jgi:hypothetical protein